MDTPKTATFFLIQGRVILDTIGMHICICSICICYSHSSCSKSSAPHSAFASARLMALRRLVAGRALDFEQISKEDYQKISKVSLALENK